MERLTSTQIIEHADGNNHEQVYCFGHLWGPAFFKKGTEDYEEYLSIVKRLAEYEDLEEQGKLLKLPCVVGDTVHYRYDGMKIAPMCVEEIIIAEYGTNLLLAYCGNDEKLKKWKINIESTAIDCKIIFLTQEEAEAALEKLKEDKGK